MTTDTQTITGTLIMAPECRTIAEGRTVARFTLRVDTPGTGGAFVLINHQTIVAWGRTAENAKVQLAKGSKITLEGRKITRAYTSATGKTRNVTEVVMLSFTKL